MLVLKFQNEELQGLEVRARSLSMGRLLDVSELKDEFRRTSGRGALVEFFKAFEGALEYWNLEDESGPVPQTVDGLLSLDMSLALMIVTTWFDAMASVGDDLGKGSTSGVKTLEASMPMELG